MQKWLYRLMDMKWRLLRKSAPSVKSLVGLLFGLADDAWNWLFTVSRGVLLE
jgi:hypothetical protein